MKKHLLSTSALVAAGMIAGAGTGLVAGSGSAQAQTAPASSPIQVTVGGYMRQYFGYTKNDNITTNSAPGPLAAVTGKPSKFIVDSDTEIYFQGKTTLANGISIALRVELEGNTSTDMIDESFASIEGAFGRLEMGSTDNAGLKTAVTSPVWGQFGNLDTSGPYGVGASRSWGQTYGINSPLALSDDDANKISYYTPRFEGFQLGLTYTPENAQDRVGGAFFHNDAANNYVNGMSAGLNFTRAFGAIDVQASAGYTSFKKPTGSPTTVSDPEAYAVGLQVGYAGFRVGGSWGKTKDQQALTSMGASNAIAAGSQALGTAPAATDFYNDGETWSLGGTYTFGPATVGIRYTEAKNKGGTLQPGDDKLESIVVGGAYTLGPGVSVGASVFHVRTKGEGTTVISGQDVDNNKSYGVIGGLLLNF